jgi:hypothetical protein
MSVQIKAAVSVSEMARMVGLSRARFYQLIGTAFPHPVYSVATRRPFFDQKLQEECLAARRLNRGAVDGRPILFYARRPLSAEKCRTPRRGSVRPIAAPTVAAPRYASLVEGLKGLGLASVTNAQVGAALQQLYPQGTAAVAEADLLRAVFVRLMASGPAQ